MAAISTAGVEFTGNVMRYSEIEHLDAKFRLLRLGNCEFEFDAAAVVYQGDHPEHIETVRDALKDVFQDTEASFLRFVLPSNITTRFSSVVPAGSDEEEQMEQIAFETRLLGGESEAGDVFPAPLLVSPDTGLLEFSVSHLEPEISENLTRIGQAFPTIPVQLVPSSDAAFLAFRHVAHRNSYPRGVYLLIGSYGRGTDLVLIKDGSPLSHTSVSTPHPSDVAYHALLLVSRFGILHSDLKRVFIYGEETSPALVSIVDEAFGEKGSIFNPSAIVDLEEDRFEENFPIQAFVPSMGAAIQ